MKRRLPNQSSINFSFVSDAKSSADIFNSVTKDATAAVQDWVNCASLNDEITIRFKVITQVKIYKLLTIGRVALFSLATTNAGVTEHQCI